MKTLLFDFTLPEENDWLLLWEELPLFFYCGGDQERVYFDRVQNPVNLKGAFLWRKSSPSLTNCEQRSKPKGRIPEFLTPRIT